MPLGFYKNWFFSNCKIDLVIIFETQSPFSLNQRELCLESSIQLFCSSLSIILAAINNKSITVLLILRFNVDSLFSDIAPKPVTALHDLRGDSS